MQTGRLVSMATEKSKMLAGELYDAADPELAADRARARAGYQALNAAPPEDRDRLVAALLGQTVRAQITPPFFCDYGYNIELGNDVYFNLNCMLLDVCSISIGSQSMFGPGVHIYTASHPLQAKARNSGLEFGRPVVIGHSVWVGGGAIICPGVTVGDESVIGAGSVVTRSVPAGVLAAGNPCRVIRRL